MTRYIQLPKERIWRIQHQDRDMGRVLNLPASRRLEWPS